MLRHKLLRWLCPHQIAKLRRATAGRAWSLERLEARDVPASFQTIGLQDQFDKFGSGSLPPDTMGAIGPNHFVESINSSFAIYTRSGTLVSHVSPKAFFDPDGGGDIARNGVFDPRILYDRNTERWFATTMDRGSTPRKDNGIILAVSRTNDPTGAWDKYFLDVGIDTNPGVVSYFTDYSTLGVDGNGVYFGMTIFQDDGDNGSFESNFAKIVATPLAPLIAASPSLGTQYSWSNITDMYSSPQPAFVLDGLASDGRAWIVSSSATLAQNINYRTITWSGGSPTLSSTSVLTTAVYGGPLNAPASGSTTNVNVGDDRLQMAVVRNNRLWTARTIGVNSTGGSSGANRTGAEWFELNVTNATPTVVQTGRIYDSAANDPRFYYYPSIAVTGQGHARIGFSGSKSTEFVGAYYSERLVSDSDGFMSTPTLIKAGEASYTLNDGSGRNRWGDYSYTSLDPLDNMTAWTIQEYAESNGSNVWGTWAHSIAAPAPTLTNPNGSGDLGTNGVTLNLTGTGFYEPGASFPNHLNVQLTGGAINGISNYLVTYNNPTSATVKFDIAANASLGLRDIVLTNPDGQQAIVVGGFTVTSDSTTSVTLDGSNNLVIADFGAATNDTLIVRANAANSRFEITDPNNNLMSTISGSSQPDAHTVYVPFGKVTGTKIIVNSLDGNDTLTVDHSVGLFAKDIEFTGGNPTAGPGDKLIVTGGTFATGVHTFIDSNSGKIALTGNGTITYTGLEPVDMTGSTIDDLFFNLPAAASDAILEDDGNSGNTISQMRSKNSTFELTTFSNPTKSLTINRGNAADDLTIAALPNFNRTLTVGTTANRFDNLTVTGKVELAADFNLSLNATTIDFPESSSDVRLLGTGKAVLNSSKTTHFQSGSSLTSADGDVTLTANEAAGTGNFIGVIISSATLDTTGGGNISISGTGGSDLTTQDHRGVDIVGSSLVTASGSGKITITGTGGNGISFNVGVTVGLGAIVAASGPGSIGIVGTSGPGGNENRGVSIADFATRVETAGGDLSITGTSKGTDANNFGVAIVHGPTVKAGGAGKLTVNGIGGNGGSGNQGVRVEGINTKVVTGDGDLSITGTGQGSGVSNTGIHITSSAVVTSGKGMIELNGTGGTGTDGNTGVIISSEVQVSTAGGTLTVIGTSTASGQESFGVHVRAVAILSAGGGGAISIAGTGAGTKYGFGVIISDPGTKVSTVGGNLDITGTSKGTLDANQGVIIWAGAVVAAGGAGNLTISGTGGDGTNNNVGVLIELSNATVRTVDGDLTMTGTGKGSGTDNTGVLITSAASVVSTAGKVTIVGTGGIGTTGNHGVQIMNAAIVSTLANDLTIMGDALGSGTNNIGIDISGAGTEVRAKNGLDLWLQGTGSGKSSAGLLIRDGAKVESTGTAIIDLIGSGSQGTAGDNQGVVIQGTNTIVNAVSANLFIVGIGDGTGSNNRGVSISAAAVVSTGSGAMDINGTADGDINDNGNTGVYIVDAGTKVMTTGGNLELLGTGGGFGANNIGVQIANGALVSITGNGKMSIDGLGGPGTNDNYGVFIASSGTKVTTASGQLYILGQGNGDKTSNHAVFIATSALVSAGAGGVHIEAFGASSTDNNDAVRIASGATVTAAGGNVLIDGEADGTGSGNVGVNIVGGTVSTTTSGNITLLGLGSGSGSSNHGVAVDAGVIQAAGPGAVTLTGTGGNGTSTNVGVLITGVGAKVDSTNANIVITGLSNGTAAGNFGVDIALGAAVNAGGVGKLEITGTSGNGTDNNYGVLIHATSTKVTTAGGDLTITGTGRGNAGFNHGVEIFNDALVSAALGGKVDITGTGGNGGAQNHGVLITGNAAVKSVHGFMSIKGIANSASPGAFGIELLSGVQTTGVGNITLFGDNIDISGSGAVDANTRDVAFVRISNGQQLNLGGADSTGVLGLTDAELDRVTATRIVFVGGNTGKITISAAITRAAFTNLQLDSGNGIDFAGGALDSMGGYVLLNSSGAITTDSAGVDVMAGFLSVTCGAGSVGSFANPLRTAATTLQTIANSPNVDQYYHEIDNVGVTGLSAAGGNITLLNGQFTWTASQLVEDATGLNVNGATIEVGAFNETIGALRLFAGAVDGSTGLLTAKSTFDLREGSVTAALGGAVGLLKTTNGVVTIGGTSANQYTGTTVIEAGTILLDKTAGLAAIPGDLTINDGELRLEQNDQIADGFAVTLLNPGRIALQTSNEQIGALTGTGNVFFGADSLDRTLTVGNTANATFSGNFHGSDIVGGAHLDQIVKTGAGTWTVAAAGSFTGQVVVNEGTLLWNGTLASSPAPVIVNSGATFGGTGTIGRPVTVNSGATIAPGASPGTLHTGTTTFSAGAKLLVEIAGNTPADIDVLDISGGTELNDATLTLAGAYVPVAGDSFTFLQASAGLTGLFAGLSNGSNTFLNGRALEIAYGPAAITLTYDSTPNVRGDDAANHIVVRKDGGGNIEVVVDGVTLLDTPAIDLASLVIDGAGGSDDVTIDYGFGGFFTVPLTIHGGAPTAGPGDQLLVKGGNFTDATVSFGVSADAGTLEFTAGGKRAQVVYTGLEPLDISANTIEILNFVLPSTGNGQPSNIAVLEDDGKIGNSFSRLRSDNERFETTTFATPTTRLEVISGNNGDDLVISSLPDFDRSLYAGRVTKNGLTFEKIMISGTVHFAADRDLIVEGGTVEFAGTANLTLLGNGEVSILPDRQFLMQAGAKLTTVDGEVFVDTNAAGAAGDFAGIAMSGASLQTTGAGDINLTGRGGSGIKIHNNSTIAANGIGNVDIFGFRTDGQAQSLGTYISGLGTTVRAKQGYVNILGASEGAGSDAGHGVVVSGGALIETTGNRNVTLEGFGRGGRGVDITDFGTVVRTKNGTVWLMGTGAGDGQTGLAIANGARVETTGVGALIFEGIGADGAEGNVGIFISDKNTVVASAGGNLSLNGTGRGTGASNPGVRIAGGARLIVSGAANVDVIAAAPPGTATALHIAGDDGAGTFSGITAAAGDVILSADEMELGAAESITGSGRIFLQPGAVAREIILGGTSHVADTLTLTLADLAAIDQTSAFAELTIGRSDSTGLIATQGAVVLALDTTLRNPDSKTGVAVAHPLDVGANDLSITSGNTITSSLSGKLHADRLLLTAAAGIGSKSAALATQVNYIAANTLSGGVALANGSTMTVGVVAAGAGDVELRTADGNLDITPFTTITAAAGAVSLKSADNLLLPSGASITGVDISLFGDTDNDGAGSLFTLFATFTTANPVVVVGNNAADEFEINNGTTVFALDGSAGNDTLDLGLIIDPVDLDISGPGSVDGFKGKINLPTISTFDNINSFINIAAPVADAGGPYVSAEGQSLILDGTGSVSSTGLPLQYAWELDGDNDFNDVYGVAPTVSWGQLQSFGIDDGIPPGSKFVVKLRVSDGAAPADDAGANLTLNNAPATATLVQDATPRIERRPTTIRFNDSFDPSTADAQAGFTYFYDFNNDGDFTDPGDINGTTTASAKFTFPYEGAFAVHGRIMDKDGDFTDYTISAKISNVDVFAFGGDKNLPPRIRVQDASTLVERFNFYAFDARFKGGVRVAAGDLNNDGMPEIVAASGAGMVTKVRVFDGVTGVRLHELTPFGTKNTNGAFVGMGDVNADGFADIITATDAGVASSVIAFDGKELTQNNKAVQLLNLAPYPTSFKGGVRVAAGDVDGDGFADIITVPGAGLTAQVKVFSGKTKSATPIQLWTAFVAKTPYTGGAFIAAGDVDGDGKAEVTVSQGATTTPRVQMYRDGKLIRDFQPFTLFSPGPTGVRVLMQDRDGDGKMDLVVAPGPGVSRVRVYKGNLLTLLTEFEPFGAAFKGGVYVG